MRVLIGLMVILLAGLQYKSWFGDVGYSAVEELRSKVAQQHQKTLLLERRNRILTAEVLALKAGRDAVEARARSDLGMIKRGETFYFVPETVSGTVSKTPW
ncbi:MAG: septum formation initiator family protein [Gammaproteobacteria bacterium]|nr:septum formation initiator family protein [Gammaproteobacteria bacterium]